MKLAPLQTHEIRALVFGPHFLSSLPHYGFLSPRVMQGTLEFRMVPGRRVWRTTSERPRVGQPRLVTFHMVRNEFTLFGVHGKLV